jgi:hypothetical protein
MIAIYLIFGILILFFLRWFFFSGRIPKYNGLSQPELIRYFSYLFHHALADGGTVHVEPEGFKAAVNVTKQEHLKKPTTIKIKLSSGYVARSAIADVSNAMSKLGYECKLNYTNSNHSLHSMTIALNGIDSFTPTSVVDIIGKIFDVIGASNERTYEVFVYGPLKAGFVPEDGIVIKHTRSLKFGRAVGFIIGRILRITRGA